VHCIPFNNSERGLKVIIAGAGGAAHLPGMVASKTIVPVLGVPVQSRALSGQDSLLSIARTSCVCLTLKAATFSLTILSSLAIICAAKIPAFFAPASPIASVPT
jgi:phosphoribosylaminoimidazole carboxylase PurE protein